MSFGVPERGDRLWTINEETSRPFIKRALEGGINFIANVYSEATSEEIVGRALKDFSTSGEVVIAAQAPTLSAEEVESREAPYVPHSQAGFV